MQGTIIKLKLFEFRCGKIRLGFFEQDCRNLVQKIYVYRMYIQEKWWNINLEVLSRRSFSTFGSLKNLKKSFQIYFYSNHYFLSDELFCKNHFYIWIDQWAQFLNEIYSPANREYFWFIHYIRIGTRAHRPRVASSRQDAADAVARR